MRRFSAYFVSFVWGAAAILPVDGQDASVSPTGSVDSPVDPEHAQQLETCRAGLLDPEAREAERRRWADLLISYDTPEARALVVELMRRSDRPNVQRTLCNAIGDKARVAPDRIDPSFAEPLLQLLGAEVESLRSAAARTLADFHGTDVPNQLGAIAASAEALLPNRLAAVDALAPNTHRREVVGQLIPLLNSGVPQIVERTVAALAPTARGNLGADVQRWEGWWEVRSRWREEDWLAEQLDIYRQRVRRLTDDFEAYQDEVRQSNSAVEAQFRLFQHELFRMLPAEQRDARLVEWLDSPLPLTNGTALAIIQARIADEGKRPESDVLAALLRLLRTATGDTQGRVLQIVQTLNAPSVVDAILGLLDQERDPASRHAILSAVGKLDNPKAIPALIREIADDDAPRTCIREAAIALGRIAGHGDVQSHGVEAVEPIKRRYASLDSDDNELRAALVSAMAGLGFPAFAPELLESLDSDDATIVQPALRGLIRLNIATKVARFRTLTSHADPQVRLAAVEGVAQLGSEESDLETLVTRLKPSVEANEPVREEAWRGFVEFVDRRPMPERIKAANRLRDTPTLEVRYLTALADSVSESATSPVDAATVLDMLAFSLASQGKYAEAASRWRQLLDEGTAPNHEGDLLAPAVRWLQAALRAPTDGALEEVLKRTLALAPDEQARDLVTATVRRFLESTEFGSDPDRATQTVGILRANGVADWTEMLERAAVTIEPADLGQNIP